jgi:EAL domain-containing protein (putative c-di-GMP-specific phosphodiesterase class I)
VTRPEWLVVIGSSATELSRSLEAEIVLEGVETEQDRLLAVELGIPMVQGYLLTRPMPLDDMAEWAKAHRPI